MVVNGEMNHTSSDIEDKSEEKPLKPESVADNMESAAADKEGSGQEDRETGNPPEESTSSETKPVKHNSELPADRSPPSTTNIESNEV